MSAILFALSLPIRFAATFADELLNRLDAILDDALDVPFGGDE